MLCTERDHDDRTVIESGDEFESIGLPCSVNRRFYYCSYCSHVLTVLTVDEIGREADSELLTIAHVPLQWREAEYGFSLKSAG